MEIRYSQPPAYPAWSKADQCAKMFGLEAAITSTSQYGVRFTLPGASVDDHDRVIRALLTLDPDATIRTARACYEGLRDFEAQLSVRGK